LIPRAEPAMPGKAAKVVITERQQDILHQMVHSRSCPQGLAQRARIILLAFERWHNGTIADHLGGGGPTLSTPWFASSVSKVCPPWGRRSRRS
jgi:hypothetical protein